MVQGYDSDEPRQLSAVESLPVRTNFNALATAHIGSSAPSDPQEGWRWIDTSDALNIKFKIYLSGVWRTVINDLEGGAVSPVAINKYTHLQTSNSTQWIVQHNMGTEHVIWAAYDASDGALIPNTVQIDSEDQVTFNFATAQQGKAIIIG